MTYSEDDFLMISGLQHFYFCRRQWALIHIEQQWVENYWTMDGRVMHKNAHDAGYRESRGDCIVTRGMKIHSSTLGLSGECDVVEFHKSEEGIPMKNRDGLWLPYPIEYKRGKEGNHTEADELQLCAQAMCLEEMLCCKIPVGALYYGEVHHRHTVEFTPEFCQKVRTLTKEMHEMYKRRYTPKVKPKKGCNACSLKGVCLPKLTRTKSVSGYMQKHLED